jgi:hypothetical protein
MDNVIDIRTLRPLDRTSAPVGRLLGPDNCPFCGARWIALTKEQRRKHIALDLWPTPQVRKERKVKHG